MKLSTALLAAGQVATLMAEPIPVHAKKLDKKEDDSTDTAWYATYGGSSTLSPDISSGTLPVPPITTGSGEPTSSGVFNSTIFATQTLTSGGSTYTVTNTGPSNTISSSSTQIDSPVDTSSSSAYDPATSTETIIVYLTVTASNVTSSTQSFSNTDGPRSGTGTGIDSPVQTSIGGTGSSGLQTGSPYTHPPYPYKPYPYSYGTSPASSGAPSGTVSGSGGVSPEMTSTSNATSSMPTGHPCSSTYNGTDDPRTGTLSASSIYTGPVSYPPFPYSYSSLLSPSGTGTAPVGAGSGSPVVTNSTSIVPSATVSYSGGPHSGTGSITPPFPFTTSKASSSILGTGTAVSSMTDSPVVTNSLSASSGTWSAPSLPSPYSYSPLPPFSSSTTPASGTGFPVMTNSTTTGPTTSAPTGPLNGEPRSGANSSSTIDSSASSPFITSTTPHFVYPYPYPYPFPYPNPPPQISTWTLSTGIPTGTLSTGGTGVVSPTTTSNSTSTQSSNYDPETTGSPQASSNPSSAPLSATCSPSDGSGISYSSIFVTRTVTYSPSLIPTHTPYPVPAASADLWVRSWVDGGDDYAEEKRVRRRGFGGAGVLAGGRVWSKPWSWFEQKGGSDGERG